MRIEIDLSPAEESALEVLREKLTRDLISRGEVERGFEASPEFTLRMLLRGSAVASRIKAGPPPSKRKKQRTAERAQRMIPGPDDTAAEGVERW